MGKYFAPPLMTGLLIFFDFVIPYLVLACPSSEAIIDICEKDRLSIDPGIIGMCINFSIDPGQTLLRLFVNTILN
jgi:hypothetical protein